MIDLSGFRLFSYARMLAIVLTLPAGLIHFTHDLAGLPWASLAVSVKTSLPWKTETPPTSLPDLLA